MLFSPQSPASVSIWGWLSAPISTPHHHLWPQDASLDSPDRWFCSVASSHSSLASSSSCLWLWMMESFVYFLWAFLVFVVSTILNLDMESPQTPFHLDPSPDSRLWCLLSISTLYIRGSLLILVGTRVLLIVFSICRADCVSHWQPNSLNYSWQPQNCNVWLLWSSMTSRNAHESSDSYDTYEMEKASCFGKWQKHSFTYWVFPQLYIEAI